MVLSSKPAYRFGLRDHISLSGTRGNTICVLPGLLQDTNEQG